LTTLSGLILFFFVPRNRRRSMILSICVVGFAAMLLSGCGGNARYQQTTGTPKGTYNITVTGTSWKLTHSSQVQVVVK
jgi:hypothetical protein